MLKNIPSCISPDLMHALMSMGHGEEIVLADADFPAHTCNRRVLRADGLRVGTLLSAILPFFPLDPFVQDPVMVMAPVDKAAPEPPVWGEFRGIIKANDPGFKDLKPLERFEFYDRARQAFAVVVTSEPDGNLILKKGPVMC
jgi:L-fucose mutarotase